MWGSGGGVGVGGGGGDSKCSNQASKFKCYRVVTQFETYNFWTNWVQLLFLCLYFEAMTVWLSLICAIFMITDLSLEYNSLLFSWSFGQALPASSAETATSVLGSRGGIFSSWTFLRMLLAFPDWALWKFLAFHNIALWLFFIIYFLAISAEYYEDVAWFSQLSSSIGWLAFTSEHPEVITWILSWVLIGYCLYSTA